jgi:hypothetical protein
MNEMKLELMKMLLSNDTTATATAMASSSAYTVGKNYVIRTVTMTILGKLKAVYDNELVLESASWVADTGRFNEFLKDTSKVKENEPFQNDAIVGRGAIVDCTEVELLQLKTK